MKEKKIQQSMQIAVKRKYVAKQKNETNQNLTKASRDKEGYRTNRTCYKNMVNCEKEKLGSVFFPLTFVRFKLQSDHEAASSKSSQKVVWSARNALLQQNSTNWHELLRLLLRLLLESVSWLPTECRGKLN